MSAALLAGALATWATSSTGAPVPASTGSAFASVAPGATATSGPSSPPTTSTTSTTAASPPSPAGATGATGPTARPASPTPAPVVSAPTRLAIPRIGLVMPVEAVAVASDGQMALPATPDVAGWYRWGPAPDSRSGATVIAGHVDTRADGVGPMAGLAGLRAGDVVEVDAGSSSHRYRVASVTSVHKTALDLPALFDRSGPPRLHLVTCGGRYDRVARHYEDNVVVVATPEGA